MNRRDAVLALLALGAAPVTSVAQPPGKVWRIGFLYPATQAGIAASLDVFKQAFRELRYIEGRNYVLEPRFADGHRDRLPALAEELVRLKVDLIMAAQSSVTLVAKNATSTIPIVMISSGDPVGAGVVKSLGRPGGNVTGNSNSLTDIAPKHLDLLRDTIPKLSRVAVMMDPTAQTHRDALSILQKLAPSIGVQILPIEAASADEIEKGFSLMTRQRAQGLIVVTNAIFFDRRERIAELAIKAKLPCVGYNAAYADAGFLIGYGANRDEFYRRTAYYVDRILKGAKPADLPVEQPMIFETVINMKTAKALRLTFPQVVLVRADRAIE